MRLAVGSRGLGVLCSIGLAITAAGAEEQVWDDACGENVWSTSVTNWAGGAVWTNGNSAVFSGGGGTVFGEAVDVSELVTVSSLTFLTNGYTVADADSNGTLTFAGGPSVISVVYAGSTAVVSEVVAGAGLTKTGAGMLQLKGANTYTGVTTVSSGVLRLNANTAAALGANGPGNHTVVEDGAMLDVYSAYSANVNEDFIIKGTGVGGLGALVNLGPTPYYNVGYRNLTLTGDATIGGSQRFDMSGSGTFTGNGYTLTKVGGAEMAISRAINGSPIVINAGTFTIQHADALGGATAGATTLNGGKLQAWGGFTLSERLYINGGTISASGTSINTFKLTGNMTLNSNVVVQTEVSTTNTLDLAGVMDGAGGFTRSGSGSVYVTGDANTYSGPTIVSSGTTLWVGKTNLYSGVLGAGTVTNYGTLHGYSSRISDGFIVNMGGAKLNVYTGMLGAVRTINQGTLNAYSSALGAGEVVNSGTMYCIPPQLEVGRIVNSGTLYGTSVLQAANGVVNSGTLNSYPGAFGTSSVTNIGTLNLYTNVLTYGEFVNHGTLNFMQAMTLSTPMTFNGGTVYLAEGSNTLYLAGPITVNTNFNLSSTATSTIEVSNVVSGPGGITRSGDGWCFVTGDANTYTGPTIINGGKTLYVGKAGFANGRLGPGAITNNGTLYFDSDGAYTTFKGISGTGTTDIRYRGTVTVDGGLSSNGIFHVANGTLALTNGALFNVSGAMTIANRDDVSYSPKPTNVVAVVTVSDGCLLRVANVTFGNGGDLTGGTMTGILNQVGGVVRTTGAAAEGNGIRLGHYPQTRSFYNMMGGTLIVEADWDLGCATDGNGWFNMTGGEVFAKRVMLNERDNAVNPGGNGRFTLSGGTLNLGSLTGSTVALSNGLCADPSAPYLVELGGAGGTIRAVTNLWMPVAATLSGSGTNAITFDTREWAISLTNRLSGPGGLNKVGAGTLLLSGNNVFTGLTHVAEGTVLLGSTTALTNSPVTVAAGATLDLGGLSHTVVGLSGGGLVTNGALTVSGTIAPGSDGVGVLTLAIANAAPCGVLAVDVTTNGLHDVLHVTGDLSLEGMSLQVVDVAQLAKHQIYTVVKCDGALSGRFAPVTLPDPWYVYYDWDLDEVQLRSEAGTLIRVR